ncbi:hypothetical protein [Listeria aquatica]|uniref:Lipoprotein n=1 Tax=Listeria aquatica FSL S10-1188 TaxID=1265818 RepID=W7ATF1_9LIST|nr:hypothetical protein [Listeria aquatica]EUJ16897.1 hypothetical protein MAQA_14924 [Listeria aquatica FSL S10-1188]
MKAIKFLTILFILSIPLILVGCTGHSSSDEKHKSTKKQSIITEKPFTVEVNETKKMEEYLHYNQANKCELH